MPSYATANHVGRDALIEFLSTRHCGTLVTRKRDESLQMSPVTCGVDVDGRIVIATYPKRAKVYNARRDARVSISVSEDGWSEEYVQVDGRAEVLDLPEALEPLIEYFRGISGEHSDWDEYRAAMSKQGKCIIRITIDHWGPLATGGFPPELAAG